MKKYILLAGVALATMTASNVMADNYSDVTVKANIELFNNLNCTPLDFGIIKIVPTARSLTNPSATITLNTDDTIEMSGAVVNKNDGYGSGVLEVTEHSHSECSHYPGQFPTSFEISNGNSSLSVKDIESNSYAIGATLVIPDVRTVEAGEYTGTFTTYTTY